jgi:hypothetical protein
MCGRAEAPRAGNKNGTIANQLPSTDMPCKKGKTFPARHALMIGFRLLGIANLGFTKRKMLTRIGAMRCCELGSAVHELRGFLHRMQDPDAQTKEDAGGKDKGFR